MKGIVDELMALDSEGSRTLPNGTRLICRRKPGDLQYLHCIHGSLDASDIAILEQQIGRQLPPALRDFYLQANGLYLFADSLSIGGLRTDYSRKADDSAWQPVSLEYGNTLDRAPEIPSSWIAFGFYPADPGADVSYDEAGGRILATPRYKAAPILYQWTSLAEMLLSEVERLSALYRMKGGELTRFNPFKPPWEEPESPTPNPTPQDSNTTK
ncbi:SMI1/KNR4 family protein [Thiobacillus denitrificans]|uniref:SMI1/KNR4 family protein n=1 Tax=Thiobacillus denitrificans TaxID=36861 RepID=UPI0012F86F0F|nr:SMI1/KNR4 family protein [Thiobacillus denitrificans]